MKLFLILLPIFLLSCSEREITQEAVADRLLRSAPNYPNVQFYIHEAEHQGAYSTPIWEMEHDVGVSFSTRLQGEPEYALKADFLGASESSDVYSVTVTLPEESGSESFTREIEYQGQEIELWRGETYKIGLRPKKES